MVKRGNRKLHAKWEKILKRNNLGMERGRMGGRLVYVGSSNDLAELAEARSALTYLPEEDEEGHRVAWSSHGLVSPVYNMAPSGDYFSEEEREVRARVALKELVSKHGKAHVKSRIERTVVDKEDEPIRLRLLASLSTIPDGL